MGNSIPTAQELRENITKDVYGIVERDTGAIVIEIPQIPNICDVVETDPEFRCTACDTNRAIFMARPCQHRILCVTCLKMFKELEMIVCDVCGERIESIF